MINQMSILGYFFQAGIVVKLVMLILLGASIASWMLILQRTWYFKHKKQQYDEFYRRFWESPDLSKLYSDLDQRVAENTGLASIFYAGFKEFTRQRQQGRIELEPIQRVMQISHAKEEEEFETHLPILASVGSVTPYVGLFGTVWGIMPALQALGAAQQATIALVAPGISEALVATAMGLFTAIPAVIAYNRLTTKANTLLNRYDLFQEELVSLISQQTTVATKG